MAFYQGIGKAMGKMPAAPWQNFSKDVFFSVFPVVKQNLRNPVQLYIAQKSLKQYLVVLDSETFPFFYPVVSDPSRQGKPIGPADFQQIDILKSPVPGSLHGISILNW